MIPRPREQGGPCAPPEAGTMEPKRNRAPEDANAADRWTRRLPG
jgi:hypothetical protein